jgi:hypothetical protein
MEARSSAPWGELRVSEKAAALASARRGAFYVRNSSGVKRL